MPKTVQPLTVSLTLALAGCTAVVDPGSGLDAGILDPDAAGLRGDVNIVDASAIAKSLTITAPAVMNALEARFDFGVLLGEVGAREAALASSTRRPGQFMAQIFSLAHQQQLDYKASLEAGAKSLGELPDSGRYIDVVTSNWTDPSGNPITFEELKQRATPASLASKSFRLLAVVNRMDLAGDMDERINQEATAVPRYLGEIRLVYGLVVKSYEAQQGQPFPMTLELSYRLPVIKRATDGSFALDPAVTLASVGADPALWRRRAEVWARAWANLSKHALGSAEYRTALEQVLALVATPDNFLTLKTNTKIRSDEYELREWYIFDSGENGLLIPRKLRREPYRCLAGSKVLADLVQHYWVDTDLDMSTRDPSLPKIGTYDEDRAGYAILRDQFRPFLAPYVKTNAAGEMYWRPACGNTYAEMPLQMIAGEGRTDPPTGDPAIDRLVFLAPFTRVKGNGAIWKIDDVGLGVTEPQRHAFAIRTCSGCHSQEGATVGFHVAPRLANAESQLSPFLSGTGSFTAPSTPPTTYSYAMLETRRVWLNALIQQQGELYSSLRLPSAH